MRKGRRWHLTARAGGGWASLRAKRGMAKSSKEEVDVENLGTWTSVAHDGCEEACVVERAQCRARKNSGEGGEHQSRKRGGRSGPVEMLNMAK